MERLAGRVILLWGWRRALLAFVAGALLDLAQAPYDFFAVGFVSFTLLVWILDGDAVDAGAGPLRRLIPAFAVGWWFGLGYFLAGLWWIGAAFLVDGGDYAWLMPIGVLAVPVLLAVFYGLACALARCVWSDGIGRISALAAAFAFVEWLREWVFTGFPWNPVGFAAMPIPLLMQSVSAVGMMGMNVLTVFVFAMPALLAARRQRLAGLMLAVALCAAHVGFGAIELSKPATATTTPLAVRIVQPSVAMSLKWEPGQEDRIFERLLKASAAPPPAGETKPQLIVWPETALPFLLTDRPDALATLGGLLADGQLLLTGAVRAEGADASRGPYYNAVIAIDSRGQIVDAVDKVHLVPGGEYLPFAGLLHRIGIDQLVAGPMNFTHGTTRHPIVLSNGLKALPFICYEVIFPGEVAAAVSGSNLILTVTNDAWFGDTPGPYQHFRQAQIRAVETGLPVVRAANTGISGVIDSHGRVLKALPLDAEATIDATLPVDPAPKAERLVSSRIVGWSILALCCALALAGAAWRRRDK